MSFAPRNSDRQERPARVDSGTSEELKKVNAKLDKILKVLEELEVVEDEEGEDEDSEDEEIEEGNEDSNTKGGVTI